MSSSSSKPHPPVLELKWTGKGTPTPLSQKLVIGGVKESKWILMETPSTGEWCAHAPNRAMSLYIFYILLYFSGIENLNDDEGIYNRSVLQ